MGFKGAKENLFDEKRIIKEILSVWDQMKKHILRLDVPKHDVPFVDKGSLEWPHLKQGYYFIVQF
ncbi:hypothetical protein AM233_06890 [Bacillus sp. FJAT-22058]|nr:hypothetical protein AM233_06890 [Bacillus sp. FJAT-22058]